MESVHAVIKIMEYSGGLWYVKCIITFFSLYIDVYISRSSSALVVTYHPLMEVIYVLELDSFILTHNERELPSLS